MRQIDADALMEVFRGEEGAKALDHSPLRLIKVKQIVDNAPTIDAIPVEWLWQMQNRMLNSSQCTFEECATVGKLIIAWQKEQEATNDEDCD